MFYTQKIKENAKFILKFWTASDYLLIFFFDVFTCFMFTGKNDGDAEKSGEPLVSIPTFCYHIFNIFFPCHGLDFLCNHGSYYFQV